MKSKNPARQLLCSQIFEDSSTRSEVRPSNSIPRTINEQSTEAESLEESSEEEDSINNNNVIPFSFIFLSQTNYKSYDFFSITLRKVLGKVLKIDLIKTPEAEKCMTTLCKGT